MLKSLCLTYARRDSRPPQSAWNLHTLLILSLLAGFATLVPSASAQDFSLLVGPLTPPAVAPGGQTSAIITITALSGFSGPVALTCQVTSLQTTTSLPVCTISPDSMTASGSASATITTTGSTTETLYTITITATDSSGTLSAPPASLTVLAVSAQFTITIQTAVAPSSVAAGSGAQGIININPINGYTSPTDPNDPTKGGVTLSCASVTPLVTIPPICSFDPPNPTVNGTIATSTLTISSYGPVTTGAGIRPRGFYALWLPLPMLALAGIGAVFGKKRSGSAYGIVGLLIITGILFLVPACGNNTTTSTTTPNGITPANSYTFGIVGVDINGVASSNTGTTSTNPTVTLTVTAPAN